MLPPNNAQEFIVDRQLDLCDAFLGGKLRFFADRELTGLEKRGLIIWARERAEKDYVHLTIRQTQHPNTPNRPKEGA